MTDGARAPRKKLRVGHVSERRGVNAVRSLLESSGLVVDEIDGRSDYGRDLNVELVIDGEITGCVVGVQVKASSALTNGDSWEFPHTDKDIRFWDDSSIPVLGVLVNPETAEMRWTNLSASARAGGPRSGPFSGSNIHHNSYVLREPDRLDDESLPALVDYAIDFIRQSSNGSFLGLFDEDDDVRCAAVSDCWALGRTDPRAFLVLRHSLGALEGASLAYAVYTLSHVAGHPDVLWSERNWIPEDIKRAVRPTFQWSPTEIFKMVAAAEHGPDGTADWGRGTLGQCVVVLLAEDSDVKDRTLDGIGAALSAGDLDSAWRTFLMHQYFGDSPMGSATEALNAYPALREHPLTGEILDFIHEHGWIDVL